MKDERRNRASSGSKRPLKTLDRALSKLGAGSRTQAREWISAGRVRVNGRRVTDPEAWVDVARDRVEIDGERQKAGPRTYLLVYKPKGVITSRTDPQGRRTVHDLLPHRSGHLFTVGRLDLDTSGLIIVTNDSQLAERMTNPDFHVDKTYLVKASARLSDEQLDALRRGVELDDGPTRPAKVVRLRDPGGRTVFEITLTEGRNRQVRRMVEALGAKVLKLVRVRLGPLEAEGMKPGDVRELTPSEVAALGRAGRSPAKG